MEASSNKINIKYFYSTYTAGRVLLKTVNKIWIYKLLF